MNKGKKKKTIFWPVLIWLWVIWALISNGPLLIGYVYTHNNFSVLNNLIMLAGPLIIFRHQDERVVQSKKMLRYRWLFRWFSLIPTLIFVYLILYLMTPDPISPTLFINALITQPFIFAAVDFMWIFVAGPTYRLAQGDLINSPTGSRSHKLPAAEVKENLHSLTTAYVKHLLFAFVIPIIIIGLVSLNN